MSIDLLQLLEARLWIARLGESDVHRWWRSDGILGPDGAFVGPRVFPKTHPTGRSRIAFAVARHACDQRHPDPKVLARESRPNQGTKWLTLLTMSTR